MNRIKRSSEKGLTLIETLVAITILTVAIVAPMSLTIQSLAASYYARDQVVAFHLAQEAIESVRAARDANILKIALAEVDVSCSPVSILCGIPIDTDFTVDTRDNSMTVCTGVCPNLQTDGNLYGYETGWVDTNIRRTVHASYTPGASDEITLNVTVYWQSGNKTRTFTLSSQLYRWLDDDITGG